MNEHGGMINIVKSVNVKYRLKTEVHKKCSAH